MYIFIYIYMCIHILHSCSHIYIYNPVTMLGGVYGLQDMCTHLCALELKHIPFAEKNMFFAGKDLFAHTYTCVSLYEGATEAPSSMPK